MKSERSLGLLIIASLAIFMLVAPVAACNPSISKTCDATACTNCPMTCTITVTPTWESTAYELKVVDVLPAGATDVSSPDGGSYDAGMYTWNPVPVPACSNTPISLSITFTPTAAGPLQNTADVQAHYAGSWYKSTGAALSNVVAVEDCTPSPEFPTVVLPVTMIIGFLGSVLLIQKSRDH